jgi:hypothetical protein
LARKAFEVMGAPEPDATADASRSTNMKGVPTAEKRYRKPVKTIVNSHQ